MLSGYQNIINFDLVVYSWYGCILLPFETTPKTRDLIHFAHSFSHDVCACEAVHSGTLHDLSLCGGGFFFSEKCKLTSLILHQFLLL